MPCSSAYSRARRREATATTRTSPPRRRTGRRIAAGAMPAAPRIPMVVMAATPFARLEQKLSQRREKLPFEEARGGNGDRRGAVRALPELGRAGGLRQRRG